MSSSARSGANDHFDPSAPTRTRIPNRSNSKQQPREVVRVVGTSPELQLAIPEVCPFNRQQQEFRVLTRRDVKRIGENLKPLSCLQRLLASILVRSSLKFIQWSAFLGRARGGRRGQAEGHRAFKSRGH
jgi:hypothetical protein